MPVRTSPLMSDRDVAGDLRIGLHRVGHVMGLCINVTASGTRSWVFRYTPPQAQIRLNGATSGRKKPRAMGLGRFPDVNLAMASRRAEIARRQLAKGIDPLTVSKQTPDNLILTGATSVTLGTVIESYLTTKVEVPGYYRSEAHQRNWRRTLEIYVIPHFGHLPIIDIDTGTVLAILHQRTTGRDGTSGSFWFLKPNTASRVRGRLEAILDWATFHDLRPNSNNPARWSGHLQTALVSPERLQQVQHLAALPYVDLPEFMEKLLNLQSNRARMLEYSILAACRANEVRYATWHEIDFQKRVWAVPSVRMKTGRAHNVPLTDRMIEILQSLPRETNNQHIFVGASKLGALPEKAMRNVIRDLGYDVTQHGFRSTFRDWAAETGADWVVAEYALAHSVGNATMRAYQRSDLLEERRKLMADWAEYCLSKFP